MNAVFTVHGAELLRDRVGTVVSPYTFDRTFGGQRSIAGANIRKELFENGSGAGGRLFAQEVRYALPRGVDDDEGNAYSVAGRYRPLPGQVGEHTLEGGGRPARGRPRHGCPYALGLRATGTSYQLSHRLDAYLTTSFSSSQTVGVGEGNVGIVDVNP